MKIYLLTRTGKINHDEYMSKVIIARNPAEARSLANIKTGDEGKIWEDIEKVLCLEIDLTMPSIVLASFKPG